MRKAHYISLSLAASFSLAVGGVLLWLYSDGLQSGIANDLGATLIVLVVLLLSLSLCFVIGWMSSRKMAMRVYQTNAINRRVIELHNEFLVSGGRQFLNKMLEMVLGTTDSDFGFIGVTRQSSDGRHYLKILAISNIAWDQASESLYRPEGMEFHNLNNLFGKVVTTGLPILTNDPGSHIHATGLPEGHPALDSFFGLPLKKNREVIGMIGLANRPGGYRKSELQAWKVLFDAVTEIVLSRELLKELDQVNTRYKDLFERSPYYYLVTEQPGMGARVVNCNQTFLDSTGHSRVEVIGRPLSNFVSLESAIENETTEIGLSNVPVTVTTKADNSIFAELTQSYESETEDGSLLVRNTLVDTTKLRNLMIDSDATLSQVLRFVKGAKVPVFAIDVKEKVLSWNKSSEDLTGYKKAEVIGKPLANLLSERCLQKLEAESQSGNLFDLEKDYELELKSIVSGFVVIAAKSSLLKLPIHGVDEALLFTGYDITKSKEQTLEVESKKRIADLTTLTGAISHQVNNMLSIVRSNFLEIASGHNTDEPVIRDTLQSLTETQVMIDKLASFTDSVGEVRELLDASSTVNKIVQKLGKEHPNSEISLVLCADAKILVDYLQLEQALTQLCANSFAHTQPASCAIHLRKIEVGENEIGSLKSVVPGTYLSITVKDTGTGIANVDKDAVLSPFYTTKEIGLGAGLGLNVVQGFVRRYGGALILRSIEGKGSSVVILLPIQSADTPKTLVKEWPLVVHLFCEDDNLSKFLARACSYLGCGFCMLGSVLEMENLPMNSILMLDSNALNEKLLPLLEQQKTRRNLRVIEVEGFSDYSSLTDFHLPHPMSFANIERVLAEITKINEG